eukprot:2499713-Amphidinium_carterae.1
MHTEGASGSFFDAGSTVLGVTRLGWLSFGTMCDMAEWHAIPNSMVSALHMGVQELQKEPIGLKVRLTIP